MDRLSMDELERRYGSSTERRIELYERLGEWLTAARATQALRRVWVFGSFVSDKPGPGDLDVLALFAPEFDPLDLPTETRHWFDHELCREIHEIDLFFLTESSMEELRELVLDTFRLDRSGRESMAEIAL